MHKISHTLPIAPILYTTYNYHTKMKLSKDDIHDKVGAATAKSLGVARNFFLPSRKTSNVSNAGGLRKSILIAAADKGGAGLGLPRKSVTLAATASSHHELVDSAALARKRSSGFASDRGGSDHSMGASKPKTATKAFIVMNHRPVAVLMESETEPESTTDVQAPKKTASPKTVSVEPPDKDQKTVHKGVRTFRIWNVKQQRKSIAVKVKFGDDEQENEAEKIFETSQMRHKTFREWHRQAKSTLPSVSGGAPVENVADIINMSPTLQKDAAKTIQKTIRRLSLESAGNELVERRQSAVKVDYTKVRVIPSKRDLDTSSSSEDDDEEVTIDINTSDEEEEKFRQLQAERKKAGQDIKEKIKSLRELGEHLSNKRHIRQELVAKATGIAVLDTEQIPIKEQILYVIEEFGGAIHDLVAYLVIWEKHIREINGRFGVVIASYFIWLRQMIAMEVFAFIVTNGFIIIPQIVEDVMYPYDKVGQVEFRYSDLINGEGYFHHSYLYYSGYKNRNEDSPNPFYNPAFRFVFCMLFMFMVLTFFIFSRLTRYYQSVRMESKMSGVAHMEHFKSIICGWDYSCRDSQAKIYLHKIICREMYMLARASEQRPGTAMVYLEMEHKKLLSYTVKRFGVFWGPWVVHIVGNVLILLACVVLGLILVQLCQVKLSYYVECIKLRDDITHTLKKEFNGKLCPNGDLYLQTWILSLPALFASMTTLLLTKFILFVGDNETWNTPERKIYATMIRAGLFYFTNIGVFYTFWILKKEVLRKQGFVAETIFGKELYRLVVLQGLMDVVLNFGVKCLYHLIRRKKKGYVMTEFRTEYCSLSMFFIHSVSRIGTLFCPPISIFVTLRMILDFYQNRFALIHLSAKESYSAHASQVYGPFLLTFFILCYLITSFMNVYYITETYPSDYNGPFLVYKQAYDEVLGRLLKSKTGISWLKGLSHPAFLVTLNVTLLALVLFCREWGRTYEPIIENLNDLISQERGDRELLLKAIFEIGKVTTDKVKDPKSSKMRRNSMMDVVRKIVPADEGSASNEEADKNQVKKVEAVENKVDEQITELIHRVQTKRKSVEMKFMYVQENDKSSGKQNQPPRKSLVNPDSEKRKSLLVESKRQTMADIVLKAKESRMDNMNAILNSIVDNRRKIMKTGLTSPSAPTSAAPSASKWGTIKQNVRIPTMPQQSNQVAETGAVRTADTDATRKKASIHLPGYGKR